MVSDNANTNVGIDPKSPQAAELRTALARKSLHPASEWLYGFLATQRPTTPASALASTASFRLLAGDITTTIAASAPRLPQDIHNVAVPERRLPPGDVIVQVLDVEDIGRSRWEQIEAIEAIERGEGQRGRTLFRVGVTENEDGQAQINTSSGASTTSKGPHKLLLQDAAGMKAYGIELLPVEGLSLSMAMGAKMALKGCRVARGVILLEPATTSWHGGKIEALHLTWIAAKKERLVAAIEMQSATAQERENYG